MKNFLIFLVILAIFSILAFSFKDKIYIDLQNQFMLTNTTGWKQIAPKENAYKSFVTLDGNVIVSYSDIRFLPKPKLLNDEKMMEIEKESCEEATTVPPGKFSVLVDEFPQSMIKGYKCQREGVAEVTKAQTIITSYSIHNLKDKILIITTSYPKDNGLEKVKVENFIESLIIW
jgi:hypothetical protein